MPLAPLPKKETKEPPGADVIRALGFLVLFGAVEAYLIWLTVDAYRGSGVRYFEDGSSITALIVLPIAVLVGGAFVGLTAFVLVSDLLGWARRSRVQADPSRDGEILGDGE